MSLYEETLDGWVLKGFFLEELYLGQVGISEIYVLDIRKERERESERKELDNMGCWVSGWIVVYCIVAYLARELSEIWDFHGSMLDNK